MRTVPRLSVPSLRLRAKPLALLAFSGFALVVPSGAMAAVERVETPIVSASPQSDVAPSLVRLHVPLPAQSAPHPEACDWIQYLRYRPVGSPADPMQADAVTVLMPGILEGANAFDPLARNAVREAKRRGRSIEVWAMDRRANCMEDLTGLDRFEQTGNAKDATDYYFKGAPIDGRTFAGWKQDDRFLADVGLEQTVKDYYSVLTTELPSQPWREKHVLCGGHSLGGPLTQIFGGWDFDGNKATTEDAGYRQCAGFVGFESMLDLDPTEDFSVLKAALGAVTLGQIGFLRKISVTALRQGKVSRTMALPGADPRSTAIIEMVGIAASKDPNGDATPLLKSIPKDQLTEDYWHLVGSHDLARLTMSKDSIRDYHYSNAGLLGQLFDDNGSIVGGIRASFGFFEGGGLKRNKLADQVSLIPGVNLGLQRSQLFLPRRQHVGGPATGWRNYDEVGRTGQPGDGVTTPTTEVTDARDFARIQFEGPSNFTEGYFPTRIVTDLAAFYIGDRGQSLSGFKHSHPLRKKPRMVALGGSGVARKAKLGSPDPFVLMPGYEHVDSITAAEKQNDGKPEGSSKMLADMVDAVVAR